MAYAILHFQDSSNGWLKPVLTITSVRNLTPNRPVGLGLRTSVDLFLCGAIQLIMVLKPTI